MQKNRAPEAVQNWCKPSAHTGANPPARRPVGEYIPYEELSPAPSAAQLPAAVLGVCTAVAVLALRVVTLGTVKLSAGIARQQHMEAKRRRWRAISAEAAADNFGRGHSDNNCPAAQIKNNVGNVTIVHNYFISQDKK